MSTKTVEHKQVAGWGGGDSDCGAECACGVAFDGFETFREAHALLDQHIADANRAATYSPQGGSYGLAILCGLGVVTTSPGRLHVKHVYGGTVPAKTVAERRTRNRVARKSRRTNRLRGA